MYANIFSELLNTFTFYLIAVIVKGCCANMPRYVSSDKIIKTCRIYDG